MLTSLNPTFVQSVTPSTPHTVRQKAPYILARVTHVVVGPTYGGSDIPDPYYKNPTDIGNITYQLLQGVQDRTTQSGGNPVAKPANSAIKHMPLEGEMVLLIPGPSPKLNENRGQQDYYYLTPFNIWNASHHNAFPDLGDVSDYSNSTRRSYEQTLDLNQTTNLSVTQSTNYPLNPEFEEKATVKSLRTFIGDVTIEGRWGNSIRFGSTTANRTLNTWSTMGAVGNPITIIRNGQGKQENDIAWIPTVENINRDPSSIYLTQGQEVNIDDINSNFSLASLDVVLESTITVSVPVQQQLTSVDTISPLDQDKNISSIT
jgi:hypothetical protein